MSHLVNSLPRQCSATFEQRLAFGAISFAVLATLSNSLPFWATFEQVIGLQSVYQAETKK